MPVFERLNSQKYREKKTSYYNFPGSASRTDSRD